MRQRSHHTARLFTLVLLALLAAPPAALGQRVQGFDVSEFQGNINWATAYNKGVRFAFIRSCRGGPLGAQRVDLNFHANMAGSSNVTVAGVPVTIYTGNYHFGRPDTMVFPPGPLTPEQAAAVIVTHAHSEADFFYGNVRSYLTPSHLRPVLDLEVGGNSSPTGRATLSFWANTFLDRFEALSGVEPMIYTNTNYATSFFDASLSHRDLWVANWSMPSNSQAGNPPTGVFPGWAFWQYSSPNGLGAQYGVSSTDIDLNVAHGDMAFLQTYLVPEPAAGALMLSAVALLWRVRRLQSLNT